MQRILSLFSRLFGSGSRLSTGSLRAVVGGVGISVVALATPFIANWEGKRNHTYLDTIASPPVLTVCYGHTGRFAIEGAWYSDSQCEDILRNDVGEHWARLDRCLTNDAIPVSVRASILELGFNVGTGAVCQSTMVRLANAGRYREACDQLGRWVNAGGRQVRGLVNRRNASVGMCERDL